jgi:hypothetical protein
MSCALNAKDFRRVMSMGRLRWIRISSHLLSFCIFHSCWLFSDFLVDFLRAFVASFFRNFFCLHSSVLVECSILPKYLSFPATSIIPRLPPPEHPAMKALDFLAVTIAVLSASGVSAVSLAPRSPSPRVISLDIERRNVNLLNHDRSRRRKRAATVTETLDNEETLYFANITLGTPAQSLR